MLDKFASWAASGLQNFIITGAIASAFFGGLYLWAKDKWKDAKHGSELKAKDKDLAIAMEPNKPKPALIKWLRDIAR